MKKLIQVVCVVVMSVFAVSAFAQEITQGTMDKVRDALKAKKRAFVAVNMELTEPEDAKFWPVYDSYQNDMDKVNMKIGEMIGDYAKNYNALTDEKAKELLKTSLALEKELLNLRDSYVAKFSAVLPAKKVARYYQLENKIQAVTRYDMAEKIPLVK
jgi:hypothetical protein